MKVDGKGVARAFKELPRKQRGYMFKAIRKSVNEGVRLAKTMAPKDTGDLAQGIHAKYEVDSNALVGSVEAAASDAESQIKALSVEFGRQYTRKRRQPARTGISLLARHRQTRSCGEHNRSSVLNIWDA